MSSEARDHAITAAVAAIIAALLTVIVGTLIIGGRDRAFTDGCIATGGNPLILATGEEWERPYGDGSATLKVSERTRLCATPADYSHGKA